MRDLDPSKFTTMERCDATGGDRGRGAWRIEEADGARSFVGRPQGGQSSRYVLFVMEDAGTATPEFRVLPVGPWYSFQKETTHRTLSLDEAETEMLRQQKNRGRRTWMMSSLAKKERARTTSAAATPATVSAAPEAVSDDDGDGDDNDNNNKADESDEEQESEHEAMDYEAEVADDDDDGGGDDNNNDERATENGGQHASVYSSTNAPQHQLTASGKVCVRLRTCAYIAAQEIRSLVRKAKKEAVLAGAIDWGSSESESESEENDAEEDESMRDREPPLKRARARAHTQMPIAAQKKTGGAAGGVQEGEVRKALLLSGRIQAKRLARRFRSRLPGPEDKAQFAQLVKKLARIVVEHNQKFLVLRDEYRVVRARNA